MNCGPACVLNGEMYGLACVLVPVEFRLVPHFSHRSPRDYKTNSARIMRSMIDLFNDEAVFFIVSRKIDKYELVLLGLPAFAI